MAEVNDNSSIQLFEDQKIRTAWDAEKEEWYFSIVDVVAVLTEQKDSRSAAKYWSVLKVRLKNEGSELTTNCSQLKMKAADGKRRLTDVANTEQLLRIIQSIPPKRLSRSRHGWQWWARNASRKPSTRNRPSTAHLIPI